MSAYPSRDLIDYSMFHEIVIESIATGIVTINLEGNVLSINKAAEKIFGVKKQDAIGSNYLYGLDRTERPRLKKTIDYVIHTGKTFCGYDITTINCQGKTIHINTYVSLFENLSGKKLGVVMLTEDITQKRKMEEEMRITDKLAAMGELALGVAHEIRNPLGSIKGLATLAKNVELDADKRNKYLDVIIKEVDRLERVSNEMLDFARRQELEQNPVDINEIIRQIIFLWELNASMYNIRVLTELQDNLPSVSGDELKLRQVFINLGRNALQAIGENGTISIKTFANAYWVIVKITDSGVGIPPNKLHKIFDPYYTTKESGSGLGLSVVHQIVSAHGGHIEVDSKIGEGTTVTVKLPVKGGKDS